MSDGASSHRCQPGNVRFLEASDGASIHRCQPGNVRFLEASDGASIHRCQPGNVRFLEVSDGASSHRCQPGNVRFLEASDGASIHCCQPGNVRFLEASGGASFTVVQGNNVAENRIGDIKQKMCRFQLKGRSGPGRATVETLFAAHMLRKSGLFAVLDAVRLYRMFGITSSFPPVALFQEECINHWLKLAG